VGNQSVRGALTRLLGSESAGQLYWVVSAVVIGSVGILLAARAARRGHEMIGILTCALTGLLTSPVSWAHHWVWIAPALVVVVDTAMKMGTRTASPTRPADGILRPASRDPWLGWRRWAGWVGLAAVAVPFFLLPQELVPDATVQGVGARGAQLLTGNLYVIVGLAALCLVGTVLIVRERPARGALVSGRT